MSENSKDPFVREPRYVVFKLKDISAYLDDTDCRAIERIGEDIAIGRRHDGKPPFNAVVVEQDWPEFDLVWSMIEARMTGAGNDHRRHSACANACRGIPTENLEKGNQSSDTYIGATIGTLCVELAELKQQRDELQKDAGRYRWLRDSPHNTMALRAMLDGVPLVIGGHNEFDAAIDAAIAKARA